MRSGTGVSAASFRPFALARMIDTPPALASLRERLATVTDLARAAAVLEWDAETFLPDDAAEARAHQTATLRRLAHATLVDDATGRLLDDAADAVDPDDEVATALVAVARRDRARALCLPDRLVADKAEAAGRAVAAWQAAREASDFAAFRPHLERIVALNIEEAEAVRPLVAQQHSPAYAPASDADARYDALLDTFEPGTTIADVGRVFAELTTGLVPLVAELADRPPADDAILHRPVAEAAQWALSREVALALGYDTARGRLDASAHPFSTSFSRDDVRITTRIDRDYFPTSLFGTIHEVGHALYEQGVGPELERTPLCEGTSLGMHESQSRLWENLVGRSRGFWTWATPVLQRHAPGTFDDATPDALVRALGRVAPSPIRIEADELTYHLHILLRVEIERALIGGSLAAKDVPEAWNEATRRLLGFTPANDAEGCLQDVHWAHGTLGYFPTYTLGTLMSVPLFEAAARDLGLEGTSAGDGFEAMFARGEFAPLLGWLRTHVHRWGRVRTATRIFEDATGAPLSAAPWLAYARRTFGA